MRKNRLCEKCYKCVKYDRHYINGARCTATDEIIPTYKLFNSLGICTLYRGYDYEWHKTTQKESFMTKIKKLCKKIIG